MARLWGGTSVSPEAVVLFAEMVVSKKLEAGKFVHQLEDEILELERFIEKTR